jgi:hypothetical protein
VRYHAYLSKGRRLAVVELEFDATLKPGDEFPHKPGIYVVTDVKPGYGGFDAILFADLVKDDLARSGGLESPKPRQGGVMPLARVVTFDGVSSDRMAEMQSEMEGSERPDNVPAKEIIVLHDPEAEKSLVVVFFETDEDYQRGDEALSAMPAGDTPGQRTSVAKYQVAFRMTD